MTATSRGAGRLANATWWRGETAFLATAALVHAGNYAFNLILSRMLGPAEFAELNLVVVLLLALTLVTHGVQLAAARATAQLDVRGDRVAAEQLHAWLRRRALLAGTVVGVGLVAGAPWLQAVFASPSGVPFVVFGMGMPAFVVLGADRGRLQGQASFGRLAVTNATEMVVRLGVGVGLVALGAGVPGAVAAVTLSFLAAAAVARPAQPPRRRADAADIAALRRSAPLLLGPSLTLLAGQVLVANADVLVVKGAVDATTAGHYAALALLGRAVFYATATLVDLAFPLAARRFHAGGDDRGVLRISLVATAATGAVAVLGLAVAAGPVIRLLFGDEFLPVADLAWRYAAATSLFSLSFVLASHSLARSGRRASAVLVAGGVLQTFLVATVRSDIAAVVDAQVAVMAVLLVATSLAARRDGVLSTPPWVVEETPTPVPAFAPSSRTVGARA